MVVCSLPEVERERSTGCTAVRNKLQNVHQESVKTSEQTITETHTNNLVSELQNKPTGDEQPNPSPRKRVIFNSSITTYEHVSIHETINSLPEECNDNIGRENPDDLKTTSPSSHSLSDDDRSVISSVGSYPPNHWYHNARDSDDEYEEYGHSDLDDFDDEDDYDEHSDGTMISGQEVSGESFLASSMESRTGYRSPQEINEEVGSFRDRSDNSNSVLKPIENNTTQWKAAKSKSDRVKNENQEIAVDTSLSKWLVCPQKNMPRDSTSLTRFKDRTILGASTVEELRQISGFSSPKKSPGDEMPIIGTVGTHWHRSALGTHEGHVRAGIHEMRM